MPEKTTVQKSKTSQSSANLPWRSEPGFLKQPILFYGMNPNTSSCVPNTEVTAFILSPQQDTTSIFHLIFFFSYPDTSCFSQMAAYSSPPSLPSPEYHVTPSPLLSSPCSLPAYSHSPPCFTLMFLKHLLHTRCLLCLPFIGYLPCYCIGSGRQPSLIHLLMCPRALAALSGLLRTFSK